MDNMINIDSFRKTNTIELPEYIDEILDLSVEYDQIEYKPKKIAPDAIKDLNHIRILQNYFISKGQYRNNLIFTIGISLGLRAGDILKFKFGTFLSYEKEKKTVSFNTSFYTEEEKTSKLRLLFVTNEMKDAFILYLQSIRGKRSVDLNDYLFMSESKNRLVHNDKSERNNGCGLKVDSVSDAIRRAVKATGLPYRVASHTMRKTFAYRFLTTFIDDRGNIDRDRAFECLQKSLNHASKSDTLKYIGITDSEIQKNIMNMYDTGKQLDTIIEMIG